MRLLSIPNKKYLYIIVNLLLLVLMFFSGFYTHVFLSQEGRSVTTDSQIITREAGNFTATAFYSGNNTWDYTVSGSFSNQCVKYDISTEEAQTVPEQVMLRMVAYRPTDESLCAKTIQNVKEEGSFSASPDAELKFTFDEKQAQSSPTGLEPERI